MALRLLLLAAAFSAFVACERTHASPRALAPPSASTELALPVPVSSATSTPPKTELSIQLPSTWRYSAPAEVRSQRGMVVTDSSIATQVGRDVLSAGGNAADAAIATAFALAVAYPTAGNVGGGGFALSLIRGEVRALDFRETAPAAASRNMYTRDGKVLTNDVQAGVRSVAVPGSVAGLWELYQAQASKRIAWRQLLEPAIRLAEQGFVVDEEFEHTL